MGNSTLPRITVVTPSYNQGKFLEETILSVINQNYPNLEYFVIDGGSTDNSIDIIKRYEDKIDWWVSESDKGQSDALNKGFGKATGDFFVWVNSDDVLLPNALKTVGEFITISPDAKWISGNSIWIDNNGRIIHCANLPKCNRFISSMGLLVVGGPSTFFSGELYKEVGSFKEELFFTMDVDMWWRFYKAGVCFEHIPKYLMAFRFHSESKCSATSFITKKEQIKEKIFLREKRKLEERNLLIERYGKRHSVSLLKALHRIRQLLNGNYIRAWLLMQKIRGKKWQHVFLVPKSGKKDIRIDE